MSQAGNLSTSSSLPVTVPTTFHTNSGDATPAANAITISGGTGITTSGSGSTVTITSTGLVKITSGTVDFTQTGATLITANGSHPFVIITYVCYLPVLTGFSADGLLSIGWTNPAYDDFTSFQGTLILLQGQYALGQLESSVAPTFPVPANTSVYINITSGMVATTATGTVTLIGYYL